MVDAIPALTTQKAIDMFGRFKVFTETELRSREEIKYENYTKAVNIEALTMIDMAAKQIIPAVVRYTGQLAQIIVSVRDAGVEAAVQENLLKECSALLEQAAGALQTLREEEEKASAMEDGRGKAVYYRDHVMPAMNALREPVDALEMIVDKTLWPMPSYGDLLFEV